MIMPVREGEGGLAHGLNINYHAYLQFESQGSLMTPYVLSLDQGTTSSRAVLFDQKCRIVRSSRHEFNQYFPRSGWVEHDPAEIWGTQIQTAKQAMGRYGDRVSGIGVANQRETTIVWDRRTGRPIYNAIVWQCRRTAPIIDELKSKGLFSYIRRRTGLIPDAYFSGPKITWVLRNVPGARAKAKNGGLAFGTVDTYLLWKLTGGRVHATDYSNASRTMIFDIARKRWDRRLLDALEIPSDMLPEVKPSNDVFGFTDKTLFGREIPICGVLGDQQAALFGQACFDKGSLKSTYGTGCFILSNVGERTIVPKSRLLSTIAWVLGQKTTYALEGSVFIGGAVVQWLRDGLRIIDKSSDSEKIGRRTPDSGGVFFVPALTGLGAPYWDMYARGMIIGITRDTTRNHIIRAALESICLQTADVIDTMTMSSGIRLKSLAVDGGASVNNWLMQLQSDLLALRVERPVILEATALGAAFVAGLSSGVWHDLNELRHLRRVDKVFRPSMTKAVRSQMRASWKRAVTRALGWANPALSGPTKSKSDY
jgi:glycerol kinase